MPPSLKVITATYLKDGGAHGADHVVFVTGTIVVNGQTRVKYFDPTTGLNDTRALGNYASLYAVGAVGSASVSTGGGASGSW